MWPAILAGIISMMQWYWNAQHKKRDREIDLEKRLENILEISVTYPYLEHKSITKTWNENKESSDEKYLRYCQFCDILFNYLEAVYKHFEGNREEIEKFLDVPQWVQIHSQIWQNPPDDDKTESYDEGFRNYIDDCLHYPPRTR